MARPITRSPAPKSSSITHRTFTCHRHQPLKISSRTIAAIAAGASISIQPDSSALSTQMEIRTVSMKLPKPIQPSAS